MTSVFVQNIVKRTTPGTAEATQAIKALKLLEKVFTTLNYCANGLRKHLFSDISFPSFFSS